MEPRGGKVGVDDKLNIGQLRVMFENEKKIYNVIEN